MESRSTIADLSSLVSNCYRKSNNDEAAKAWLGLAIKATSGNVHLKLRRIQALFTQIKLGIADGADVREQLAQLRAICSEVGYEDNGACDQLYGQLCVRENKLKEAEGHFLCAAQKRTEYFGDNHPLSRQSQASYISALKANEGTVSDGEYHKLLDDLLKNAATKKTALKAEGKAPLWCRWLVSLPIFFWFCWTLIDEGFRAGYYNGHPILIGGTVLIAIITIYALYKRIFSAFYCLKYSKFSRTPAQVRFKSVSEFDATAGLNHANTAVIEGPFNTEAIVQRDLGNLSSNIFKYLKYSEMSVVHDGDKPVAVETPDGLVVLRTDGLTLKRHFSQKSDSAGLLVALIALLFPVALVGLAMSGFIKTPHTTVPAGLTSYEYYRWSARQMDKAVERRSFYDLPVIKEGFEKATADKGKVGELANNCLRYEMPSYLPDEKMLGTYTSALSADNTDKKNEAILEKLIAQKPDFDWSYLALAAIDLNHKKLDEAEQLIIKAEKLNPQSIPVALSRAELELAKGNKARALEIVEGCLKKDPLSKRIQSQYIGTLLHL